MEGCETASGLRGNEIGAPLVMPATGTGAGIMNMLAIYLHTLTQACPSGRSIESAGFDHRGWVSLRMTKAGERGLLAFIAPTYVKW